MELCVIAHPHFFRNEAKLVSELLDNFAVTFHLRKPGAGIMEYESFLTSLPAYLHPQIMLHNAYPLLERYAVKGVHFSTHNRPKAAAYKGCYKSTSCHALEESIEMGKYFDVQFLSPVFPSISKQGYTNTLDHASLKKVLQQQRHYKVIALGGVDESKLPLLESIGFDGVALLGAIWGESPNDAMNIKNNFKKLNAWCKTDHIA